MRVHVAILGASAMLILLIGAGAVASAEASGGASVSLTLSGSEGREGWFVSAVRVELASVGADAVEFRVHAGTWHRYDDPFYVFSDGVHPLHYRALDARGEVLAEGNATVRIDTRTPLSLLDLVGPRGGSGWFSGSVTASVHASDASSGVGEVQFSLDGSAWSPLDPGGVVVDGDGAHDLRWRVEDVAGNRATGSASVRVDETPPSVDVRVLGPFVDAPAAFVSTTSRVEVLADDATSGVAETQCRVDEGAWAPVGEPFGLEAPDGARVVECRARDAAGHVEASTPLRLRLDSTPPRSAVGVSGPRLERDGVTFVGPATTLSATPSDGEGVGVGGAFVALDGEPERAFEPFRLAGADGPRMLRHRAVDLLGNEGTPLDFAAFLDATPPTARLVVGEPSHTDASGNVFVTSRTPLSVSRLDPRSGGDASGVASVEFRVGDGAWSPYGGAFNLSSGSGDVVVSFRARDAVGNAFEASMTLVVDDDSPDVAVVTPRPGSVTVSSRYVDPPPPIDVPPRLALSLGEVPGGAEPRASGDALARAYVVGGGRVLVEAEAADAGARPSGLQEVRFLVDGVLAHVAPPHDPTWEWDTSNLTLAEVVITVVAVDQVGNEASGSVRVYVVPTGLRATYEVTLRAIRAAGDVLASALASAHGDSRRGALGGAIEHAPEPVVPTEGEEVAAPSATVGSRGLKGFVA